VTEEETGATEVPAADPTDPLAKDPLAMSRAATVEHSVPLFRRTGGHDRLTTR
jgi:hypothetical protein